MLILLRDAHEGLLGGLTYLADVNINLQEDSVRIFVAQRVESWSYSDAGSAPVEAAGTLSNKLTFQVKIIKTKTHKYEHLRVEVSQL